MKKIIILSLAVFAFQISFAQNSGASQYKRDFKRNEVSINPFNIIAFGAFDVNYERILNKNTSLGLDFFYRLSEGKDDNDLIDSDDVFDKQVAATLRLKYFFGDRIARGFYAEGFGMLSSGEHENRIDQFGTTGVFVNSIRKDLDYTDFALGFGIGGKFVSKNGFFMDVGIGIGRNLFSDKSPDIVVKPNIYIGYRF